MSHFCLLRSPESYVAHDWDLLASAQDRSYWLDLFATHFEETLSHAAGHYGRSAGKRVAAARKAFQDTILRLRQDPGSLPGGRLNVIELCRLRESVLWANGLSDPFRRVKDRENAATAELYPELVRKLHTMDRKDRWLQLIQSVFAGNLFDLGAVATMHLANDPSDFHQALGDIKPRPWLVDDFDLLQADLPGSPPSKWSKAVIFIDNCGGDFVMGIMPLARQLALDGTQIVLAANELSSLNDLTADEAGAMVELLASRDADLSALIESGFITVVSTGNGIPLIDLSDVSDELNEAAADADLVILEGMGRAVESNFDVDLKVDRLNLALLKDPQVAAHVGGEMYDCICKYIPAGG